MTAKEKLYKALTDLERGNKSADHVYELLNRAWAKEEVRWFWMALIILAMGVGIGFMFGNSFNNQ